MTPTIVDNPYLGSKRIHLDRHMVSRRDALGEGLMSLSTAMIILTNSKMKVAIAMESPRDSNTTNIKNIQPYAPVEALLPAMRVQRFINEAVDLSQQLITASSLATTQEQDVTNIISIINRLHSIFTDAPQHVLQGPTGTSKNKPLPKNTPSNQVSSYYTRAYIDQLKALPPTEIPLALLTQFGNYRQLSLLRNRQEKLEQENTFRAAFNTYTRQLQFDSQRYVWTATAEERKKFIRQYDALPDVSTVITSDLDLRDLLRNQILDAWDDARGEFYYQIYNRWKIRTLPLSLTIHEEKTEDEDSKERSMILNTIKDSWTKKDEWEDLYTLLLRSQTFCKQWFSFISQQDQEDALGIILHEIEETQRIVEISK